MPMVKAMEAMKSKKRVNVIAKAARPKAMKATKAAEAPPTGSGSSAWYKKQITKLKGKYLNSIRERAELRSLLAQAGTAIKELQWVLALKEELLRPKEES